MKKFFWSENKRTRDLFELALKGGAFFFSRILRKCIHLRKLIHIREF